MIFSSKCACISSTILTFLPNNPVCFYNINSKKVNFSSNCEYNTGHFIDFSPKKKLLFPQNVPAYQALFLLFCPIILCVFTPKIPKKLIFPQIAPKNVKFLVIFYWAAKNGFYHHEAKKTTNPT